MHKHKISLISLAALICFPQIVFAAPAFTNFMEFGTFVLRILQGVISALFALAVLGLVYGVVMYFWQNDNADRREDLKSYLLWAVVGIFVLFSFWALVGILVHSFDPNATVGIIFIRPPQ